MGQESYLIRTGVGFDVDRRSGDSAVGFIEGIAETMNTSMMKASVAGIQERNAKLEKEQTERKIEIEKAEKQFQDVENNIVVSGGNKARELQEELDKILIAFKDRAHIFNLGHGVLPNTSIKKVEELVNTIRAK